MLSFDVKIAKIGPVDLEIICLREIIKKDDIKKKETEGKIHSPFGKFAERAKQHVVAVTRVDIDGWGKHRHGPRAYLVDGILQSLRLELHKDVIKAKPTTVEDLMDAAELSEASTRAGTTQEMHPPCGRHC